MLKQVKSVRSPSSEEEGEAETHNESIATPIPGPPALLVKGEVEKIRNEVELGKKGGVGGTVF